MLRSRFAPPMLVLLLALLSVVSVALGSGTLPAVVAAYLLVFALPGAALVLALPADLRPRAWPERVVVALGTSVVLSMLAVWGASLRNGMGILERWAVIVAAMTSLLSLIALVQARRAAPPAPRAPEVGLQVPLAGWLLVLAVAAFFRLAMLGYGEYYDDELDVVQSARSLLLGQSNVILEHRKGPTEIWLAAVAAGTAGRFDETTARLPFAIASLAAVAVTVLISERFYGRRTAVIAGLIIGVEGIFLAFSRLVQYQGVVLLMLTLVVWFALRFQQAATRREQVYCLSMGALFWSFGTLTHWDGLVVGLVLAYVVARRWLWPLRQGGWRSALPVLGGLSLVSLLAVIPPALFYVQLALAPKTAQARTYYDARVGYGLFNSLPEFMAHATFYNASPAVGLLLLVAGIALLRRLTRRTSVLAVLAAVPFLWPEFLQFGAWNLSIGVYLALLVTLLASPRNDEPSRPVALWLLAYLIVYATLIKSAGLHFYTLMPAVALLAADQVTGGLGSAPWLARARTALCALALAAACTFGYIAFISPDEYGLNYPASALAWSPSPVKTRPTDYFFGFPYRYGWNVVSVLYRQGVLRGKFDTNETYLVTDWYVRDIEAARADEPRYYLQAENAPRAGKAPADLADTFHLWGEVRVRGATRIRIHENNRYPAGGPVVYDAESYPTDDPDLLARSIMYRSARGDDRAFRDLGKFLDGAATARDVVVMDSPLQDGVLPYYYRGGARLAPWRGAVSGTDLSAPGATYYAALFAPTGSERWLAEHLYPLEGRWFGSVRLLSYAPPAADTPVQTSGAQFGDAIRLRNYAVGPATVRGGDVVRLALQWQVAGPLPARYKVFVHVLDAQGKVIAQRDAELVADLAPATAWTPGETLIDHHAMRLPANLPTQKLRVALGFYDPQSGVRLPVRDAQGALLPDGQLVIDGAEAP
ncbi:MAG: glycosyltransferase family 39 protein [Chloroflexi bacterium]|nr:glycosyltransferase family 39 protein [Chloroflexota bacterium]